MIKQGLQYRHQYNIHTVLYEQNSLNHSIYQKKVTIELTNQAQNDTTGDRSYQDRHQAKRDMKILKPGTFCETQIL